MTAFKQRLMLKLDAAMDGLGGDQPRSVYHYWHQRIEDENEKYEQDCDSSISCVEQIAGYMVCLAIKHGKKDINELTEYGVGLRDEYTRNSMFDECGFEEWFYPVVKRTE